MKKTFLFMSTIVLMTVFAGCASTDVIAKFSITSFDAVLKNSSERVTPDEANNGWSLKSLGNERFVWSKDFSVDGKSDVMMEFEAKPFLDAGLKPELLDKKTYSLDTQSNRLQIRSELGTDKFAYNGTPTPLESFKQIVATHRDSIGYHEKLDHYGVKFGNGNMFEWAKNMKTNDKDIVFVLNPKPFIDAGTNPKKVSGWAFAKVEIINDQGQKENVDKLLKPYNLE